MGCDVHIEVEVRKGEQWVRVPRPKVEDVDLGFAWYKWYDGRNYALFALLADVRNYDGTAPIAQPLGWPKDVSHGLRTRVEDPELLEGGEAEGTGWGWQVKDGAYDEETEMTELQKQHVGEGLLTAEEKYYDGDHSFTWYTLAELLGYDWEGQRTPGSGIVSSIEYWNWWKNKEKKGQPDSWCGGISGPHVNHISTEEMEKRLEDGTAARDLPTGESRFFYPKPGMTSYFTQIRWEVAPADYSQHFLEVLREKIAPLAEDPKDIRLLISFGS